MSKVTYYYINPNGRIKLDSKNDSEARLDFHLKLHEDRTRAYYSKNPVAKLVREVKETLDERKLTSDLF